jgi:hypothetical protein
MPSFGSWRNPFSDKVTIPGVVYSEDWTPTADYVWERSNRNLTYNGYEALDEFVNTRGELTPPAPDELPYTYGEQVGLVGVHPGRMQPRSFYMPTTDFGMYDYDEVSPEEKELYVKWSAKMAADYNVAYLAGAMGTALLVTAWAPLPARVFATFTTAVLGSFLDTMRVYWNASVEREHLDDFLVAKEIWYLKNVEAYQLQLPKIPRGQEAEHWEPCA